MIKVVHLNASSGGGAFTVAQRLSEALNKSGQVESKHLVFTGKPGDYQLWANNWLRKKYAFGLHALEKLDFLRYEKDASVRFAFSHGKTGIDILGEPLVQQADIVHLHWINKGFISLKGLEKLLASDKKVVWTCHDMWPFTGGCYYSGTCINYLHGCGDCPMLKSGKSNDLSATIFQRKTSIFSKNKQPVFITPSDWLKQIGENSGTVTGKKIVTIPNALNTDIFKPEGLNYRVNDGKRVILFAAVNIADKRKGFNEFREFCTGLMDRGFKDFKVVYIGENKGQFEPQVGIEQSFTGYISDPEIMAAWYRSADLYVTTSNDDNLPTTIMESMACGTPVAAFAVGGIPEMVEDEVTGVIAEVYHSDALAEKVIGLFEGRFGTIAEMGGRCSAFASENYSSQVVCRQHLDLYKSL